MEKKLERRGEVEGRGVVSYRENYMYSVGEKLPTDFMTVANFQTVF